jgi:hypothetical protein
MNQSIRTARQAGRRSRQARPLVEALDARLLLRTICVDVNSPFSGNGQSWTAPMVSLVNAINLAAPGDKIHVADGTYKPTTTSDRAGTFRLKNNVEILGGFAGFGSPTPDARDVAANPTILSGEVGDPALTRDNVYHVVTADTVNSTALLDGFTITGGYATPNDTAQGGPLYSDRGGGVLMSNANARIANCTITRNNAHIYGEGMYIAGPQGATPTTPAITNCTFSDNGKNFGNSYGGGIFVEFANPVITDCLFTRNAAYNGAGAIHSRTASPTITGCTFDDNWARYGGAAITGEWGSNTEIANCVFTNNTTEMTGTVNTSSTNERFSITRIRDSVFVGNDAAQGGGASATNNATLEIMGCEFVRNTAMWGGGAVYAWQAKVSISNSKMHGNAAQGQFGGSTQGGAVSTSAYSTLHRAYIVNCEFVGNRATDGGAIHDQGAYGSQVHTSTFVANQASGIGGAIKGPTAVASSANATRVVNSIFWNNTAPTDPHVSGEVTLNYTVVPGPLSATGTGNVSANPLFVREPAAGADTNWGTGDDDYGDLRLQIPSPAVDGGNNADVSPNYPTDIEGNPRVFDFPGRRAPGAVVDMGAHELGMRIGLIHVKDNQTIVLGAGGHTFVVEKLIIEAGGRLDILDNALAIEYTGEGDNPAAQIEAWVAEGRGLGDGISSRTALSNDNFAVGVADNAKLDSPHTLFGGVAVDATTVLVRYTHRTDLNLDGVVNGTDAAIFGTNYAPGEAGTWATGDLNMDGRIDGTDAAIFGTFYEPA